MTAVRQPLNPLDPPEQWRWEEANEPGNFWERCVQHGVVIVPFELYTDYGADGNYHEIDLIGIRFIGMENEVQTRLNDIYLSFETSIGSPLRDGTDLVGMTPEEALEKYIAWQEAWQRKYG